MTILLTGCAGFIGSNLLDKLLAEGHKVLELTTSTIIIPLIKKRANIAHNLKNKNFTLIEKDICKLNISDIPSSFFLLPSSLSIIHLSARAGVRPSIQEPLLYEKVNVGGTLRMLELAKNLKAKHFIFGSSSSVYGNPSTSSGQVVPFKEDAVCDQPISPYAATKRSGNYCALPILICIKFPPLF